MSVSVHVAPWVLPVASPPIRDGAVAVDARGVVTAVGRARDLLRLGPAVDHSGVLTPGFVNAHTHVELSHLGLVPGGDGLAAWILRLLSSRTPNAAPNLEAADRAARNAAQSMASRGTVAVADITNELRAHRFLREAGLDVLALDERIAPTGVPPVGNPEFVQTAHATYTCGAAALRALAARSGGTLRSIHIDEDPAEAELTLDASGELAELLAVRKVHTEGLPSGLRPIPWLEALGVLGANTLLVHLTFADDASLRLAAGRDAVAVLCPRSNQHITGQLPPFARIQAAGLRTALGTDSLTSSPSLDVLAELPPLARAGADPAWLLHAATVGGAQALGFAHRGALAPGMRPGLVELGDAARRLSDPIAWLAHEAADAPVRRPHLRTSSPPLSSSVFA